MSQSEAQLQRQILDYLHLRGIIAWRNNTGRRGGVSFGLPGSSDILAGIPPTGRLLAVEVKSEHGRLRPKQVQFAHEVTSRGGIYIVARCLDDVVRNLDAAMRKEDHDARQAED